MRMLSYVVILAALFFAPLQSAEIANLEPIQAVWLHTEGAMVRIITDTDDTGRGATVEDALADMESNSAGIVYLDTAQYLFASESAVDKIPAIQPYLRKSVRLYLWEGQGDIREAIKYADAHKLGVTLKQWNRGEKPHKIPIINGTFA